MPGSGQAKCSGAFQVGLAKAANHWRPRPKPAVPLFPAAAGPSLGPIRPRLGAPTAPPLIFAAMADDARDHRAQSLANTNALELIELNPMMSPVRAPTFEQCLSLPYSHQLNLPILRPISPSLNRPLTPTPTPTPTPTSLSRDISISRSQHLPGTRHRYPLHHR